jgi:uncharacterized integral membrane protein
MNWKWILIVVLLIFLVIFAVQNYEVATIQFLLWSFKSSRTIVIFGALCVGIIIGLLFPFIKKR